MPSVISKVLSAPVMQYPHHCFRWPAFGRNTPARPLRCSLSELPVRNCANHTNALRGNSQRGRTPRALTWADTPMSRKLALTFSGAVSLGSYEAGVLYEVLYALKQHNQQPNIPEDRKIYIDVLTGASAGGLSASLAAHKLLYDADSLDDPYNNPLYHAWVTDIDIEALLNFAPGEPPDSSVFSSDLIDKLSYKYLLARYDRGTPPPVKTHAAIGPEQTLRLGLALSNLCGVDYSRGTLGAGTFTYTRFQDELTKTLGLADDSRDSWLPIQKAAISCGAFPFAFRVQDLERNIDCYNSSPFFNPACFGGQTTRSFTYTDGGVFQNEPLGLAKNLVDSIDRHRDSDQRAYLFIAPNPHSSTARDSFSAKTGNFSNVAVRLLSAIFNQARFQDWIEAEKVNGRIAAFNSRALALHRLAQEGTVTAQAMQPLGTPLLPLFFGRGKQHELAAARLRLRQQFAQEYSQLRATGGPGPAAADAWIDAILTFESAAGLSGKDEMYIYGINASSRELAGSPLMEFLGFFDQEFRDHDYDIGRTKAQAFLQNPGTRQQGPLSGISYTPQAIRPLKPGLTGISIKQVPLEKRRQFRDRLKNRAGILLAEAGLSFLVRKGVELAFVNKKIDEFLGL